MLEIVKIMEASWLPSRPTLFYEKEVLRRQNMHAFFI
jgi:hypothetical protein